MLAVDETPAEIVIRIETTVELVGCVECGVVASLRTGWRSSTAIWPPSGAPLAWCG